MTLPDFQPARRTATPLPTPAARSPFGPLIHVLTCCLALGLGLVPAGAQADVDEHIRWGSEQLLAQDGSASFEQLASTGHHDSRPASAFIDEPTWDVLAGKFDTDKWRREADDDRGHAGEDGHDDWHVHHDGYEDYHPEREHHEHEHGTQPIPEADSYVLMALGLGLLAWRVRRHA
jgi:hypothetical protein